MKGAADERKGSGPEAPEAAPTGEATTPAPEESAPATGAAAPRRYTPALAYWLAGILVLVVGAVAAAPYWAPGVIPLLPWAAPGSKQDKELAARVERLESLLPRVQKLESQLTPPDKMAELARRLDRVESVGKQADGTIAEVQKLEQRLSAFETKPATAPAGLGELRQQLENISVAVKTLSGRLDAIEKTMNTQAGADATDAALVLMLLQMRDAVAAGRPFTAEYDAFAALAHERHDIAAAAAPIASAAQDGVAGREVLRQRLDALAGEITNAAPPPAANDWQGQAWARVRSLVTIRRVGGTGQSAAEAALDAAQRALAQGDLGVAIDKLETLTGAPAAAAKPWLQMAHARQTVEQALRRTEQLLTARLGAQHKSGQP